ncbi:MAG: SUMF1/EgtB/PvdO family nonheme iron enzyme, partial [Deltaproteobacteria bacterium]|nr:SUMF1/EgtB/PvdO family nonheme iron enzyme [Deltaproteobacteria bacterium]
IDTDELVKALWDTGDDPSTIKSKRKNLSSIKSSVNADLKRLYEDEKNPEGIIIGRSNVFIMSDEAKDRLLTSFTGSAKKDGGVTLEQINEVLNIVREVLSDPEALANTGNSDRTGKLSQLKNIIQGLSQQIGLKVAHGDLTDEPAAPSEVRAYETHMSHGDTKDNNNPPSPPFTKGGDTLSPPLGRDGGPSIPPLEKGDTGGFSGEIDMPPGHTKEEENVIAGSEAPHLSLRGTTESRDDLDNSAQSQKDEIPCYGGKDKAGVSVTPGLGGGAYEPGRGQGITPEGALAAGISADTGGSEKITAGEVAVVDEAGGIEEIKPEEAKNAEAPVEKEAEIVEEAELVEDEEPEEELPPEEMEEVEEVAGDAEVQETLTEVVDDQPEIEAEETESTEELEPAEITDNLEEAEVVDEIAETKPEGEEVAQDDAEVADEAEIMEEAPEEELEPEEMGNIEEVEEDEVEEGIEELEVSGNDAEPGLSAGDSEAGYSDGILGEEDNVLKARLLAEEFNRLLGNRERFYNQYILIPAGDYIVGNKSPGKDERPEQKVRLEAFYMGEFPVTNALFEVFVEKTGYKTLAERLGYGKVYYGRFKKTVDEKTGSVRLICRSGLSCQTVYGACWHQPSGPESTIHNKRNHPVVQVSLEDALAFAAWTGKRLPAEDEWEAATRTADGYVLPWGNDWQRDACNIEASSIADTTPVDRYMDFENDFGIVDAIGNVLEWTMKPCEPPSHAKHDVKYYLAKGGSWISGNDIRLFNRFRLEAETHSNILGFRCVAY